MSSFLKGLWSRTRKDPEVRQLDHPRDLRSGDFLQMSDSFGLPERLRNQLFKVVGITTSQFEYEFNTSFALQSTTDDTVDLTVESEGGREMAAFSFAVSRDRVEELFDLEEFSRIFDEGGATLHLKDGGEMSDLVSDLYHQDAVGERGYYYDKDYRDSKPPTHEGEGEPFDYYCLTSGDDRFAVEIEVYAGGETDVCLTLYREMSDIRDLWPAESQQ